MNTAFLALALSVLSVVQTSANLGSVPKGATRVPFLQLAVSASCAGPVTVTQLTVLHEGLGDASDLERVYVVDERRRLTRSRAFDTSDQTATLRFIPALELAACDTKAITIAADLSPQAAAAGEHRVRIELPTDVVADGADVRLVSSHSLLPATTVRPKATGSVHATFLDLTQPLRYGKRRTLARLQLTADRDADQIISSITLTNEGKASGEDLQRLSITNRSGVTLTDVRSSMDSDTVTLTFDPPLRIDRNDTIALELKGDVLASKRRTVRFVLEEPSDLTATPAKR